MIGWLKRARDPRHRLGLKGEAVAASHLRKQGFRILKRNFIGSGGEIDIIAERKGAVHFVEVKTRIVDLFGAPEEAVNSQKQSRIRGASLAYLAKFRAAPVSTSFDIVAVVMSKAGGVKDIRWTEDAF